MSGAETELLYLREEQIRLAQNIIFFAWRDLVALADYILEKHDIGRAHYRVLQLVVQYPGLSVGQLLSLLKITKQSLSRVIKELEEKDFLLIISSATDRRKKNITLTEAGKNVENEIFEVQKQRLQRAYKEAGGHAIDGFRQVMLNIMDENEKKLLENKNDSKGKR